jgi:hypothetical protein
MRLNVLELFTEAFDSETHDIAGTKVLWGLQSEPDALRRTSRDDIPGQESHEFTDVTHAFRHRKYHVGRVAVLATDFPDVAPQPETLRVSYLVLSYEPWPNRAKSIVALAFGPLALAVSAALEDVPDFRPWTGALLQPPDQVLYAPIWTGLAAVLLSWGPVVATIGLAAGVAFLVSELRIRALMRSVESMLFVQEFAVRLLDYVDVAVRNPEVFASYLARVRSQQGLASREGGSSSPLAIAHLPFNEGDKCLAFVDASHLTSAVDAGLARAIATGSPAQIARDFPIEKRTQMWHKGGRECSTGVLHRAIAAGSRNAYI